jgi:exoribonuclease R
MLPKEYSEDVCSLLPNRESFGISLQFEWDGEKISNKRWFESFVRNEKSYTYEEFQNSDSPYKPPLKAISSYLAKEEVTDSHKWIEQCMLLYNKEAGKILKEAGVGILRRHSAPNLEKLEKYRNYIPELEKLAFSSAEYCLAEESETNHFGLESDNYAHASSPIRRYADLVNQRILKLKIRNSKEPYIVPIVMYDMNQRAKLNKGFSRDIDFIKAVSSGKNKFNGIILEATSIESDVKVKIYIPEWRRAVSAKYKSAGENKVLSKDEKREIDVTEFREVEVMCAFNMNGRNWKERAIINIT